MIKIFLKSGKEKPVRMGHPWIFSGAISKIEGNAISGDMCTIYSSKGDSIAYGYFNSKSAISVRILSLHTPFTISELNRRIQTAIESRNSLIHNQNDSCRLINSEGDFIPGLIVDKYGSGLVIQILTAGMELLRSDILNALIEYVKPLFIYERSDTDSRTREGLNVAQGLQYGELPAKIVLTELGLKFEVDIESGQKTGFFFDQRPNRDLLRKYAQGKRMCDCFSYSGAFSVNALAAEVQQIDSVDISKNASMLAQNNIALNGFNQQKIRFITADVFKYLRETVNNYDLIVLDPPKFAKHPGEVERAARGYKDINLCAIKKITAGGIIFTFSCSNAIDPRLFRQIVFAAAADAARPVQVLHSLTAGPDHPVNIAHREGEYLKGLVLRVMD